MLKLVSTVPLTVTRKWFAWRSSYSQKFRVRNLSGY